MLDVAELIGVRVTAQPMQLQAAVHCGVDAAVSAEGATRHAPGITRPESSLAGVTRCPTNPLPGRN
jgi:hypothetical protein